MAHSITHGTHIGRHYDDSEHEENASHRPSALNEMAQRRQYGGFHIGAAFFGWVVASGIAVMLTAILAAAGSAVALTQLEGSVAGDTARTVGLVSGGLLLLALALAYYAGGYVSGRMSRFDGARQGVGVWLIGILATLVLGALGAALGSQYNILQTLNLPSIPVGGSTLSTAGLVTTLLALAVTLLAAVAGAKMGERYHRKVDATGLEV